MLKSKIESLLFISAKPMAMSQLADLLKTKKEEIKSENRIAALPMIPIVGSKR